MDFETDDDDSENHEDKFYCIKWLNYSYIDSTVYNTREFSKTEAGKILIPEYQKIKKDHLVYGFYLKWFGANRKYFYPAYIKNANKTDQQLFIYNYCYHGFEIINERFDKSKFISTRDLPPRLCGICVLTFIYLGVNHRYNDRDDKPETKIYSANLFKFIRNKSK